ncbi:glycosyltransferase family 32 protein [Mucilaginibacter sp. E4BP6]|uniref:glycosyltransferase family 32 protein n=1 Tax=Mucilaginibacter sp. E4BP6 TaxID=2723089 RepID=UPI0015C86907|nr:glycosyltransferase [Mucilaginibacter sp. E4BP6]NYE68156.1 mannosyltransferase OCH1-like enzyme [Mucilaginibacter sp. E4BP6]
MVPRIIHQLWIGRKKPPYELMNSWKTLNPDWQYIFWNEETLQQHFKKGLYNQRQYDIMPELNGKCDIARYEILNAYGGFFIDADSLCISPLDDFFLNNDSFSCYENEFVRGNLVAAGYLASTKENKLMRHLIDRIHCMSEEDLLLGNHTAWQTVGPILLTKTIHAQHYTDISVYPSYFFIPKHYTGVMYNGPAKIYAKQFWGSTPGSSFHGYEFQNIRNELDLGI